MIHPISHLDYDIYDIFYNDCNQIIIITPYTRSAHRICLCVGTVSLTFQYKIDPHRHTLIYYLDVPSYNNEAINLSVDGAMITTAVNRYPAFTNKIIMSTIVKNEDAVILQWINHHQKLGVEHFIIYDNETPSRSTLRRTLERHICDGRVVLIQWDYPYRSPISGLSGQTTQQNHSIYAFRTSSFIGLLDVDEYVNPQNSVRTLPMLFSQMETKYSLRRDTYGGFTLLNKFFYNPHNLPTDGEKFLAIYNCDKITHSGHEKVFVIPANIDTFSVHMITSGKRAKILGESECFFNHYFYLNKNQTRGTKLTDISDNSISRFVL